MLFWQQFSAHPSLLAWCGIGQSAPIAPIAMPQSGLHGILDDVPIAHVAPASAGYAESIPTTAKATILKKTFIADQSLPRIA
jgi:hypothetical protein